MVICLCIYLVIALFIMIYSLNFTSGTPLAYPKLANFMLCFAVGLLWPLAALMFLLDLFLLFMRFFK